MRLIDADALLEELPVHPDGGMRSVKDEGLMMRVRETVKNAPTIGGWRSVKYGLPRTGTVYLITLNPPGTIPQTMEAYLRHDGWWRGSVSLMSEYVTHWMPMPEPPKEEPYGE